ncbi:plant UBX domain-containing protein 1-like protein [Tanacetum coccineum]
MKEAHNLSRARAVKRGCNYKNERWNTMEIKGHMSASRVPRMITNDSEFRLDKFSSTSPAYAPEVDECSGRIKIMFDSLQEGEILEDHLDGDRGNDTIEDNADLNPSTNVYLDVNQNTSIPKVVEDLSSLDRSSDKADGLAHHNNGFGDAFISYFKKHDHGLSLISLMQILEKLDAAKQNYGREIRVFETTTATIPQTSNAASSSEEPDEMEFSTSDYYRVLAAKKIEDKRLKTKKIRDAEAAAKAAASRSRITKAVVRVRFPDNQTLEVTFDSSEPVQSLFDHLVKVVAQPDLPFYLYTIPPKKQIKDTSQDFYSAGFAPGANVYFSYDLPQGDDRAQGPFLKEDVMALKGLELLPEQKKLDQPAPEPIVATAAAVQNPPAEKKKMFKMNCKCNYGHGHDVDNIINCEGGFSMGRIRLNGELELAMMTDFEYMSSADPNDSADKKGCNHEKLRGAYVLVARDARDKNTDDSPRPLKSPPDLEQVRCVPEDLTADAQYVTDIIFSLTKPCEPVFAGRFGASEGFNLSLRAHSLPPPRQRLLSVLSPVVLENLSQNGDDHTFVKHGCLETAEVYGQVKPSNGDQKGEHVGHWERFTLRISNFSGQLWRVHVSFPSTGTHIQGGRTMLGKGVRDDMMLVKVICLSTPENKYQIVGATYLGDGVVL